MNNEFHLATPLEKLAQLTIQHSLRDIDSDEKLKSNFEEDARKNWNKNSDEYHKLLKNYVDNAEKNLLDKRWQKRCFFIISMFILLATILFSGYTIHIVLISDDQAGSKIIQVIPSLITFLTPLLVIPNAIVNYLFTTKDEEHMIRIIDQIIKHDDSSLKK